LQAKNPKISGSSWVIFAGGFYSIENAVSVEWCLQGTPFYKEDAKENQVFLSVKSKMHPKAPLASKQTKTAR